MTYVGQTGTVHVSIYMTMMWQLYCRWHSVCSVVSWLAVLFYNSTLYLDFQPHYKALYVPLQQRILYWIKRNGAIDFVSAALCTVTAVVSEEICPDSFYFSVLNSWAVSPNLTRGCLNRHVSTFAALDEKLKGCERVEWSLFKKKKKRYKMIVITRVMMIVHILVQSAFGLMNVPLLLAFLASILILTHISIKHSPLFEGTCLILRCQKSLVKAE